MATVSLPNIFAPNTPALASEVNANFDAIIAQVNGNIQAVNLANSAVTENKISDRAVTGVKIGLGAIEDENIDALAAIAATKIGTGVVTNTEFSYLSGVTSALQTQIDGKAPSSSQAQSIRVAYGASIPTKVAGHANLDVAAWPGDGQFRITHSQGDTNFAVQLSRYNAVRGANEVPSLADTPRSTPVVLVTSTYIDVWFVKHDGSGFDAANLEFFLSLLPY
jgi:hypothetical protein